MVKSEDLDQLRCEITVIPARHYNHAARALELAQKLLVERDNVIGLAKELLLAHEGSDEKLALAIVFSRLHGGKPKRAGPY